VTNVEFTTVVQEWTIDVGLNDVGHEVAVRVLGFLLN
jgi:hypothetical protein